jgi:DNA-binding transcriptional ArsR family regulator
VSGDTTPPASEGGDFFAVDWRCVDIAARLSGGSLAAPAYLVLARYTSGKDHSTTQAGATAIVKALGLTWGRADLALKALENAGLITAPSKGTTRKLLSWGDYQAARVPLTDRQTAVLARIRRKREPITASSDPDYQVAYALVQKQLLQHVEGGRGKARFASLPREFVWLPNSLVDGFRTGDTPLSRLRQIGDARAVMTLMRVYQHANLPEDGGLARSAMRTSFKRFEVGRWQGFTVWAFNRGGSSGGYDPLPRPFVGQAKGDDLKTRENEFWAAWGALEEAKLVESAGYIFDGEGDGSQPIHPFSPWNGTDEERLVTVEAAKAAGRMVTDGQLHRATAHFEGSTFYICPIQAHVLNAQLVGIWRPVYRPNTAKTRAWVAGFLRQCEGHAAVFGSLAQTSNRATA